MQEEIRRYNRDGTSSKEVEEDFPLASKAKKAKGKKSQGKEGGKNMDLTKFKFFHYHENRHYAKNYPQKKASKKEPTIAAIDEALTSQFEIDFTRKWCSFHMTWNRDLFSDFEEKYIKQNIEFGDDERHKATTFSMVTF